MKDNRGKKNILFGLLNQIVVIAFGLILPRMFIMSYGSEVNGLLSTVNQVYVYVALLEAGIGTASLQALYETLAANDEDKTNRVLAATNIYYKRTGLYYLIAVLILSACFPYIVRSEIPKLTVALVVLFNGLAGVINYFFQGKFQILLRAEGKNYLLSNLSTATYILTSSIKILFIMLGFNIVVIQAAYFGINLLQMLYIMLYVRRHYSWINLHVSPDFNAIATKNSVLVHQISGLVFSNTDVLILTLMVGLKEVSVYTLYNSFFNMVKSILFSFLDGIQYKLAQTFHSDFQAFLPMQEKFEACYMTLTFALYSVLYVMISPFLRIYTRGITDIQYVNAILPLLFTLVFLLQGARGPMQLVTDYAQHFKQTRGQAVLETIINLSVTILAVHRFGIYGALIGTIAALLYRANAIIIYTNRVILKRNPIVTYKRWGWNAGLFLMIYLVNQALSISVESYLQLVLIAIPVSFFSVALFLAGMYCFERDSFFWLFELLKRRLYR